MAHRPWWQGWVVGSTLGMARIGQHPRPHGTALVCGWRWDPGLVSLMARPCPSVFWSPDGACAPVPWPQPCVLAGPSPRLLAFPPCPERATTRTFPYLGP